jgi:hypothetical protein
MICWCVALLVGFFKERQIKYNFLNFSCDFEVKANPQDLHPEDLWCSVKDVRTGFKSWLCLYYK